MPIPLLFALGTWALTMAGTSAFVYLCAREADVSAKAEQQALAKRISLFRNRIGYVAELVTDSGPVRGFVREVHTENGEPAVLVDKGHTGGKNDCGNCELILLSSICSYAFLAPEQVVEGDEDAIREDDSQQFLFEEDLD